MGLRRVPRVGSGIALLAAAAVAAVLGLMVPATAPATAAPAPAPSVSLSQVGDDQVSVSGRTVKSSPKVRFQRLTSSGWAFATRTRAHHHRYSTTLSVAAGTSAKFRVTSSGSSRTFTVTMPSKPKPPQYDACGVRPLKADGSAWSCTFHDDFDGTALDRTKWVPQTTGFVSGDPNAGVACYVDDPDNISVGGGALSLTVRKESTSQPCPGTGGVSSRYTAGMVSTYYLFSQQYGRFEARLKNTATTSAGLHEAFWLWPDVRYANPDGSDLGEIDVSETYSVYPTLSIPFLHYAGMGPQPGINTAWDCTAYRGTWNTYTLVWEPARIEILVNGKTCLVNTSGDPAFQKPYIVALTQALGYGANAMTSTTPIPATVAVDYVRVWQ